MEAPVHFAEAAGAFRKVLDLKVPAGSVAPAISAYPGLLAEHYCCWGFTDHVNRGPKRRLLAQQPLSTEAEDTLASRALDT